MSEVSRAQAAGSVLFMAPLNDPWPPLDDVVLWSDDTRKASIAWTATSRVRFRIDDPASGISYEAYSAVIRKEDPGAALLLIAARWKEGGKTIDLRINGAGSSAEHEDNVLAAQTPAVFPTVPHTFEVSLNLEAQRKRKQRIRDYRREGFDRDRHGAEFGRIVRVLSKSLDRLHRGDDDEIINIAVHIRKLVGARKGNHALQDYASIRHRDLNVWVRPPTDPTHWTPAMLPAISFWWFGEFRAAPTPPFTHSVDFDVWLGELGGYVARNSLTNLELIHRVSDQVGAHLDVHPDEVLNQLVSSTFTGRDKLTAYIDLIGGSILALCLRVTAEDS